MSRPPKIDRKALKNPDQFVVRGQRLLGFFQKQRARFLPILIGMAVVLVAAYGYDWWSAGRTETAWKAYDDALSLGEDKRFSELKSVYRKYSQARPGYFAALGVADHFLDDAKKEALKPSGNAAASVSGAIEWYSKALDYRSLGPTEKQLVLINRGTAHETAKRYDEAINDYRKAADLDGEAKGFALLSMGRIFELKSDSKSAVETYDKISADQPNSEYSKLAKNNIRRLKSPLFKGPDKKDL